MKGLLVFLASLVCLSFLSNAQDHIELVTSQARPLRPDFGSLRDNITGLDCLSWRLAVETNNYRDWSLVPLTCKEDVESYMMDGQYKKDLFAVTAIAYDYVKSLELNQGTDVWVFDVDETCLSNLPFWSRSDVGFGAYSPNGTIYMEWIEAAKAPANRACLSLYRRLLRLGVKIVFITGLSESYRELRETNMKNVGFHTWEKLILKNSDTEANLTTVEYKSSHRTALVEKGYRIVGNMGDQWSDLRGANPGLRTFKMPNPMYYIP